MTISESTFPTDYLRTWTETDSTARTTLIERLWAPEGRLSVSSMGTTLSGVRAIAEHTGRVHDDLIAGKGLVFSYDQAVTADDALLLRWSMTAPDGSVVGRGVDVVQREDTGRIASVHMFMGVN